MTENTDRDLPIAMANHAHRSAPAPRLPVDAAFDMAGRRPGEPD